MAPELAIVVNDELYVHPNARAVSIPYSRLKHNRHHPCDLVVIFDLPFFEMTTAELKKQSVNITRVLDEIERSRGLFGIMIQVDFAIDPSRMVIRRIMRLIKYFSRAVGSDAEPRRMIIELCSSKWSFQTRFCERIDRVPGVIRAVHILENNIIQSGWAGSDPTDPLPTNATKIVISGRPEIYYVLWGSLGPRIGSYQAEMERLVQTITPSGTPIEGVIVEFRNTSGTVDLPFPLVEMHHIATPSPIREEDPDGTESSTSRSTRTDRGGSSGWCLQYTPMWQARDRSDLRTIVERDVELFAQEWSRPRKNSDAQEKNEASTENQDDG